MTIYITGIPLVLLCVFIFGYRLQLTVISCRLVPFLGFKCFSIRLYICFVLSKPVCLTAAVVLLLIIARLFGDTVYSGS